MRWRAQLRRAAMLLGGVAVPFCWLLAMPASATPTAMPEAAAAHTVTVQDVSEAWFATAPVDICTTPLGCPPADAPASPYPADTLHVGVAGGQETARSYLLPDPSFLATAGTVTHAVMTLPVATGSTDGTQSPDTARILACLATEPFSDGQQGSVMPPPKTNCSSSVPVSYDAKKSVLTIDVTTLLSAWTSGTPALGIALVPDLAKAQPSDAWHVTINGHKRTGTPHVQTTVTYTPSADLTTSFGATTTSSNIGSTTSGPPPASAPQPQLPQSSAGQPPVNPPVVAPQQQPTTVAQQPVAFSRTAPPAIAFIAPLLLLVGGVFFARVFTRDATPLSAQLSVRP